MELERAELRIRDEERGRVAADLHDSICQELIGISCAAGALGRLLEKEGHALAGNLAKVARAIGQAAAHTRQIAHDMSSFVSAGDGLMVALRELATSTAESKRICCEFACDPPVSISDPVLSNQLHRIAQEAVRNSLRHSGAKRIGLELCDTGVELRLSVTDDGCGLPVDASTGPGFGLRGMKVRAGLIQGELTVRNRDTGGTEVVCCVPKRASPR